MGGAAGDRHVVHADALAPDLQRPAVGGGLEDEDASARRRPLLDELARGQRADLLVAGEQQLDAVDGRRATATAWIGGHDPALHVEHAGPGDPAVDHRERALRERAEREHRVVVADDEDARRAAAAPVHVRSGCPGDEIGLGAETFTDQTGYCVRRCGDGDDVVRRGLDVHQPSEVGNHQIGVERRGGHRRNRSDRQPASIALARSVIVVRTRPAVARSSAGRSP